MAGNPLKSREAQGVGRDLGHLALLLALVSAVLLPQLRPLLPVDETRYLTVAWEMRGAGSNFVPHLNGEIYGHKPPLLFWLINLVWSVTGVSEMAARLVSPAFGVLAVALTWGLGLMVRPARSETAGRAALILATTGAFAFFGSLTMFDTLLTCAVLLGVAGLLKLDQGAHGAGLAMLGVALALGAYAKGPVILVHLMPLALARPLWTDRPDPGSYLAWLGRIATAVLVAVMLVGLWLGPALILGGAEYRNEVLWRQSAGRITNAFDHARPVWFFVAALPALLWPWAWRWQVLRCLAPGQIGQWGWETRLLAIWFASTLLMFSLISGKQLHYLLPALPAAALLLATAPRPRPGYGPAVLCAAVVVPVLIWAGLLFTGQSRLGGQVIPPTSSIFFLLSIVLAIVILIGLLLVGRRLPTLGWALVAPGTLLFVHVALGDAMYGLYDTGQFAARIASDPSAGIAYFGGRYQGEFGFAARLSAPIDVPEAGALATWADAHPGGLIIGASEVNLPLTLVQQGPFAGDIVRLYRVPER